MNFPCIFIVDDDTAILESFKIILELEGYRIFTATNGEKLTALLIEQVPDLILIDYNLGNDNGGLLTVVIKKDPQTSHIPIILISADTQLRTAATLVGADDVMEKPIEIPLLLSKIEQHIIHG